MSTSESFLAPALSFLLASLVRVSPARLENCRKAGGWKRYIRCCVHVSPRRAKTPCLEWSNQKSERIQSRWLYHLLPHPTHTPINLAPLRHTPCAAAPLFSTLHEGAMELYLIPNDPVNTTLISSDGILRYWVRTSRPLSSLRACSSIIQRPSAHDKNEQETLGQITWGGLGRHSVVHSDLFKGRTEGAGGKAVRVKDLLWKINTFGK